MFFCVLASTVPESTTQAATVIGEVKKSYQAATPIIHKTQNYGKISMYVIKWLSHVSGSHHPSNWT